jgi:hypothetical protein
LGIVFGRALRSVVDLLGQVVLANEAVVEKVAQRVVGIVEIGLVVGAHPAVIEVLA